MASFFLIVYVLLLALLSAVLGRPTDVYSPPVTYPHSGTVWRTGNHHNVTWDISNPPAQITNRTGRIVLVTNGTLDYEHPLAMGFDIMDGRCNITVPNVPSGSFYQVVVFGDSGNQSPSFTIIN